MLKNFCRFSYPNNSHEVDDCQTIADVLSFVTKKCTLINIAILNELVNHSGIEEAKVHIKEYQQAVAEFREKMTTRFAVNKSFLPDGGSPPLHCETITFLVSWNPDERTSLDDINDLLTDAFNDLSSDVKVVRTDKVNSIIITCSFPFDLTGLLIAKATSNLKQLKKKGLLKLTIGYCTIWNRDKVHKL